MLGQLGEQIVGLHRLREQKKKTYIEAEFTASVWYWERVPVLACQLPCGSSFPEELKSSEERKCEANWLFGKVFGWLDFGMCPLSSEGSFQPSDLVWLQATV